MSETTMKVRNQLFINNALLLGIFLAVSATTSTNVDSLVGTAQWVEHTHQVMDLANSLGKSVVDMETGQRGYMLTGKE